MGPRSLITEQVDESKLSSLPGNTHPLARAEFDQGEAPPVLALHRMLLVLGRSREQQSSLAALLEAQQDKSSPSYHAWLTPEDFGRRFGPSDQDIQAVTSWLKSHGLQVARVTQGRRVIEFSGTAAQVKEAFHTSIHRYTVDGEQHWANDSDPQIPSALAPAVIGVVSLHNFLKKPAHHLAGFYFSGGKSNQDRGLQPALNLGCDTVIGTSGPTPCHYVGPYDFATIYNVLPLWNSTPPIDGTGESIAIVARSNINSQDMNDFQALFGLPKNSPTTIVDGPDPGLVPGDETEADVDVEWSGAVAKGANIVLVASQSTETTDGVDLSALYIVDNNIAPIVSQSFQACELELGSTGNQFHNALWEQAAAQGMSVFVSAGDSGSAACDFYEGTPPQPAVNGLQVNGLASTPYNVAVGGTDFNDYSNPQAYWNTSNAPTTLASAKGYIPETTWNDSCTNALLATIGFSADPEKNCNNTALLQIIAAIGGGGGRSSCTTPGGPAASDCAGGYGKPGWQTGQGVPADGKRDLPDVSLFSGTGFVGSNYVICERDVLDQICDSTQQLPIGGTSVATPAFAGLQALVDQSVGGPQGNPNYFFYQIAAGQSAAGCNSSAPPASTCVFNDITSGTIAMPCATSSPNCSTTHSGDLYGILSGYNAGTGYDLATGLGSVNANSLVTSWGALKLSSSSTSLTLNGGNAVNVPHGTPVNAAVTVTPASPLPTGDVSLVATQGTNTIAAGTLTLANGTATGTTSLLPGGTNYSVKAHYGGNGTYSGSDSNAVSVTVTPEASQTFVNLVTFDVNGNVTSFSSSGTTYGNGAFLMRVDVGDSQASVSPSTGISSGCSRRVESCPTGTVALTINGTQQGLPLNSAGFAEDQSITPGTYTINASYPGDSSYRLSMGTASFTIAHAPTTASVAIPTANSRAPYGDSTQINALVETTSQEAPPTGTVSFFADGTPLTVLSLTYQGRPYCGSCAPPQFASLTAEGITAFLSLGTHSLTAQYSGDTNYAAGTSPPFMVTVTQATPFFQEFGVVPSAVTLGQSVTLSARLYGSDSGAVPTGTITFLDGNTAVPGTVTYGTLNNTLTATMSYTPTTAGTHNISATYSGDMYYQSITENSTTLTVQGPDFSITTSPNTQQTVVAGQTATYMNVISISPLDNFSAQVNVSCSSPAAASMCTVNPSSFPSASGTASVVVTTTARTSLVSRQPEHHFPSSPGFLAVLLLGALGAALYCKLNKPQERPIAGRIPVLSTAVLLLTLAAGNGCGGGGGASTPPPPPPPPTGTPAGTYYIGVTATSGTLIHSATLTLVVQ